MTTKVPPWRSSKAKKLLFDDIVNGDVIDSMAPAEVFMMRPEYSLYKYSSFVSNLRNLRASIKRLKKCADRDQRALYHDFSLTPSIIIRTKPRWAGSLAHSLLKVDIDSGASTRMTSNELWLSRTEYQEFPILCFKRHIRQELNSRKERAYWSFQSSKKRG